MRKMREIMLTTETFFQLLFMLSRTPALHDWQLKHRTFGSLPHAPQSGMEDVEFAVFHSVGLTQVKLHASDGLQQPDCRSTKHHNASYQLIQTIHKIIINISYKKNRQIYTYEDVFTHDKSGKSQGEKTNKVIPKH